MHASRRRKALFCARKLSDMPTTRLTQLLGIRHPILLAGMAGGPTTPELVAAVSRGGGLGVFGAHNVPLDTLRGNIRRARAAADGAPIGINVLLAAPTDASTTPEAVHGGLTGVRVCFGLEPTPAPPAAAPPAMVELVSTALEEGVEVIAVGLGDPAPIATLAHDAGAKVVAMVTTVDEARHVVASGADVVVAQGWEAGGHRSTFLTGPDEGLPSVGTFALVPQVAAAVDVPVVAAGGVMDGAGLAAALCLGADGVQLGTRFLGAREAGVPDSYRERLRKAQDVDTRIIRAVSGRPARGVPNTIVSQLESVGGTLGWPRQAAAWSDIRTHAVREGDAEHFPLWAGQAAGRLDEESREAAQIVADIIAEYEQVKARLP